MGEGVRMCVCVSACLCVYVHMNTCKREEGGGVREGWREGEEEREGRSRMLSNVRMCGLRKQSHEAAAALVTF